METHTNGDGGEPKDDEATTKPAGDVEAYESEWYEVLKRRAEELEQEAEEPEEPEQEEEAAEDDEG